MRHGVRAGWLFGLGLLVACGLPTAGTLDEGDGDGDGDGGVGRDGGAVVDGALLDGAAMDGAAVDAAGADGALPGDDASGAAGLDASALDASALDAAATDAATVDAAPLADAGAADAGRDAAVDAGSCTPRGAEDCTNGVDDDCNGLTDCADTACTSGGFECVPSVPSGWSYAALSIGSRGPCPSGFASQRDVVMDPTGGAASCSCSCSSSGTASCTDGNATFYGPGLIGDCSSIGTFATDVSDGSCRNSLPFGLFGFGIGANANVRVSKVALKPNSCSGSVQRNVPPPGTTEGKRCVAQSAVVGGGCAQGSVCARRRTGAYQACIAKSGANVCPGSYPAKHDTGTGVTDTRACSTCACGTTATCGPASVTFYASQNCQGTAVTAVADDTCRAMTTPGQGASSWQYASAVLNEGCAKTTDTAPVGSLTVNALETVCCR